MALAAVLVALLLPWCLGGVWVSALLRRHGEGNACMVLGQGYFLGLFATTVVLRVWDALGLTFSFWPLVLVLACLTGLGLVVRRATPAATVSPPHCTAPMPRYQVMLIALLLALTAWRYLTLTQELLLRPLYAWDAWMNWVPKAITWFYHGSLVAFVNPQDWLAGDTDTYTLGNRDSSTYPITVPLIQLWGMLSAGNWDDSTVFLPWIIAPLALALGLYGHLRSAGVAVLHALIACYLLLSLPYLNVHAVLAGYADIWVAAVFGLAVCALYQWQRTRHWQFALLWVVLAVMCATLKNPGAVLGLIVLCCGLRLWLNLQPAVELALWAIAVAVGAWLLLTGFEVRVPLLGRVSLEQGIVSIDGVKKLALAYHPVGSAFARSLFVMINWHLMGYLLLPCLCVALFLRTRRRRPAPEWLPVLVASGLLIAVFVFTDYYAAALNFTTLNRALLYPVPALIFCACLWFRREPAAAPLPRSPAGAAS